MYQEVKKVLNMQCICCKSSEYHKKGVKANYSLFVCENCRFEYVYPLPSKDDLREVYNNGMHKNLNLSINDEMNKLDNSNNHPHRDWFVSIIKKVEKITNKKTLNILEIGSSFGGFIHTANKLGHTATGTEVSEEVAIASKGIINGEIIYAGDKKYTDLFDEKSFDLIYIEHVLEHLPDPEEIIQQLTTLITDNGILVISVPNQKSWLAQLYGIYWDWTSPPLHLSYFNKNNLQLLLNNHQFKIQKSWTGEYYFRSIYQFFTLSMFIFRLKQILNKILKTKFKVEYKFNYLYRYPRKLSEFIELLPYFVLYPIIKLFSLAGKGNDLTIFASKK